jgi:energy-coupling factor transporter transmembrane protein EcfT
MGETSSVCATWARRRNSTIEVLPPGSEAPAFRIWNKLLLNYHNWWTGLVVVFVLLICKGACLTPHTHFFSFPSSGLNLWPFSFLFVRIYETRQQNIAQVTSLPDGRRYQFWVRRAWFESPYIGFCIYYSHKQQVFKIYK